MANIARTVETEALAGLVERVTFLFHWTPDLGNPVSNFTADHQQFRASFLKATPPTRLERIKRYLASGLSAVSFTIAGHRMPT